MTIWLARRKKSSRLETYRHWHTDVFSAAISFSEPVLDPIQALLSAPQSSLTRTIANATKIEFIVITKKTYSNESIKSRPCEEQTRNQIIEKRTKTYNT